MRVTQRSLFYWILRRHRLMQLLLLSIILASLFFKVFPLEMQKRIINEAIHLKRLDLLYLYCGLYIGAVVLAGVSKYAINVLQVIIGQKILVEIRTELYNHVLQLPLQFYRKMQPGTVISAMTSELNAIGFFLGGALAIPITSVLTFLVFLGFMYSLSPLLALLSISIYPLELVVIPLLQKRYNRINKKRIKTTRAMANVVNEAISGIHEIHSNSSFKLEEKRIQDHIRTLYSHLKKLFIVKYGIKFANNLFQSLGPFILFLVGGYLAIHGEFTLGALVAFLSAYEKVYDPWKEMLEYYQSLQDAQIRYRQIMKIFDLDPPHPLLPEGREPYRLQGAIDVKSVGFTVDSGVSLLDRITMRVRPNEQVALVGFSGSGKSTLALLIAQLYDASSGAIHIDGKEVATLSKADISRNVTMIAQHPFIFSGTIRDNLLYGVRATDRETEVHRDRLFQVVRDVGLEDDILRFGFNSVIPRQRVLPLKKTFLRMRQIISGELNREFSRVIEVYDANRFLTYSSLRDNLVFGDSLSGRFEIDNLPRDGLFRKFLHTTGLEEPLLALGHAIARQTVDLLHDLDADEFFFRGSPMRPDELGRFDELVRHSGESLPRQKEHRDMLLTLALRFIPGRHRIVSLDAGLSKEILRARHIFLRDVMQIDLDVCCKAAEQFLDKGTLTRLAVFEEEKDFIPYCPSEYLYSHSLRDNILFGALKQEVKDNQHLVRLALEAFGREGLLDEVLDIGLDFNVGSKGDRLSGGQKQKVAIARAFLRDTAILIMDEATASLDNASQARIQELMDNQFRGRKTVIAVIHRLDLAPSYDRIFVLKAGALIEQGTYEELMARKGAFHGLVRSHHG